MHRPASANKAQKRDIRLLISDVSITSVLFCLGEDNPSGRVLLWYEKVLQSAYMEQETYCFHVCTSHHMFEAYTQP